MKFIMLDTLATISYTLDLEVECIIMHIIDIILNCSKLCEII